jgi:uncharacterized protein (DUF433 family)
METAVTEHRYIAKKSPTGEPVVKETSVTVRAIAELWLQGAQPEEILLHIPHLSLAQVFDALSYYDDHKAEIDSFISANEVPDELSGTRLSR